MPDDPKSDTPAPEAPKPPAPTPPAPAAPAAKPAAPPAKPAAPAAPKPPPVMATAPWDDDLTKQLAGEFGDRIPEFLTYLGQNFLVVQPAANAQVIDYLKRECAFDYLVDVTAVHYPAKPEAFEVVYILYSFARNLRIRVKTRIKDGEKLESIVWIHPTANWLEREVFDMFGIAFNNHPDLKRILMPDEWEGHPLRKDYSILKMDERWVRENIGIESGQ